MYSTVTSFSSSQTVLEQKRGLMYWMLVAMVFLYPVWPVFIEKKIGPLPSFTPQKFLLYTLLGLSIIQLAFSRDFNRAFRNNVIENLDLLLPLAILFFLKFISCVFGVSLFYSLPMFNYEVITSLGVLFVTLCLVRTDADVKVIFYAMLASAYVIGVFVVVEAVAGRNILEPFIPKETGFLALLDKEREGARRLQGTFASPLLLAEYAALMIPVIVVIIKNIRSRLLRYFQIAAVVLMLAAIYGSRTRSALGIVAVSFGVWAFYVLRSYLIDKNNNNVLRYIVAFYGGMALMFAAGLVTWLLISLASGFSISQTLGLSDANTTLYSGGRDARLIQLEMAVPRIVDSPLIGYGTGIGGVKVGFVGTNGMITLDSYLLLNTVDNGIPATLVLIWFFYSCIQRARRLAESRRLCLMSHNWLYAIALGLCCIFFFMIVSPLSDLHALAYLLIGCLMIMRAKKLTT